MIKGYGYPITIHAAIQFIVTGPVGNGTIDTSKLVADWKYDNRVIGELRFSSVPVNIQPGTCDLIEKILPFHSMILAQMILMLTMCHL